MQNRLGIILSRTPILIRLDRPNIRGLRPHQVLHQRASTGFNLVPSARGSFLAIGIRAVREQALEELVARARNEICQVLHEGVLVLVRHPSDSVHHVSGIVLHQELRATRFEVGIGRESGRPLDERAVCGGWIGVRGSCCVVQGGKDSRGTTFFDQVAHDLVIEVLDGRPLDLLADVFFLLSLEGKLDEDLLEFLVDVVDAQLLEAVV